MRFGTMRVSQSEAQSHQDCDLQSAARLLDEGIVETLVSADAISRTRVACMCDIGAELGDERVGRGDSVRPETRKWN